MYFFNNKSDSSTKFAIENFVEFKEGTFDPINSEIMDQIKTLKEVGVTIVTTEEMRPDLISFKIYGSTQYWFLLLLYNDIIDFTDLKLGDTIRYFNIVDLEGLFFDLKRRSKNNLSEREEF